MWLLLVSLGWCVICIDFKKGDSRKIIRFTRQENATNVNGQDRPHITDNLTRKKKLNIEPASYYQGAHWYSRD